MVQAIRDLVTIFLHSSAKKFVIVGVAMLLEPFVFFADFFFFFVPSFFFCCFLFSFVIFFFRLKEKGYGRV